jgi:hypothetical protein
MLPGTVRGLVQVVNETALPAYGPDWSCGAQAEVDGSSSSPSGSCSKVELLAVTEVSALLPLCPGFYMSSCHTVPSGGPRI